MSLTSAVTIYHIPAEHIVNQVSKTACCINIVDTPGLGDTRGAAWDWKIFGMLSALINTLTTLDYIFMVTKAPDGRLTPANKFIYQKLQKLYAKDLQERMLGMFTFCD